MKILNLTLVLAAAALFSAAPVQAQKMSLKSGSLGFLKGQAVLNVEYAYDPMRVGEFPTEQEYVAKKVAEYNAKEPGKGDNWLKAWRTDRESRFQPKFEDLMNKVLTDRKTGLRLGHSKDAKYTLILKTTRTEPGYNVGVWRRNAEIDAEAVFVETADPAKELAVVTIARSPGRQAFGGDYDTGVRIAESYAKAGKELANFMWKKGLK